MIWKKSVIFLSSLLLVVLSFSHFYTINASADPLTDLGCTSIGLDAGGAELLGDFVAPEIMIPISLALVLAGVTFSNKSQMESISSYIASHNPAVYSILNGKVSVNLASLFATYEVMVHSGHINSKPITFGNDAYKYGQIPVNMPFIAREHVGGFGTPNFLDFTSNGWVNLSIPSGWTLVGINTQRYFSNQQICKYAPTLNLSSFGSSPLGTPYSFYNFVPYNQGGSTAINELNGTYPLTSSNPYFYSCNSYNYSLNGQLIQVNSIYFPVKNSVLNGMSILNPVSGTYVSMPANLSNVGNVNTAYHQLTVPVDSNIVKSGLGSLVGQGVGSLTKTGELSGVIVGEGTGDIAVPKDGLLDDTAEKTATGEGTATAEGSATDTGTATDTLNFEPLKKIGVSLSNVFPFCIPFDLVKSIELLFVPPVNPVFKVHLDFDNIDGGYITIDFAKYEVWISLFKFLISIFFTIFLILKTRDLIRS